MSPTACGETQQTRASLSVAETLADTDTAGYARATGPRTFAFPADHGPHPDFKHEWWYFTGNLETVEGGRELGFQLTFFRSALRPDTAAMVDSDWATRQAYMGHFAVTDITGGEFHAFERFRRGALGLADAAAEEGGVRVWIGDWEARSSSSSTLRAGQGSSGGPGVEGGSAWFIRAEEDGVGIELVLEPTQPVVLQGEGGWSAKGLEPGNASYYYSMMRLSAEGTATVDGVERRARGEAWLDREWGTSALGPGLAGWDWFSLQLDDDSELMVYRLRADDGATSPFSAGTLVEPDGGIVRLGAGDFVVDATGSWASPRGGRYPSGWRVRVPGLDLTLDVEPRLRDQELDLAFRYWEGAVVVVGRRAGRGVAGKGYVELTGY